jgi:bacteriorhodopsin
MLSFFEISFYFAYFFLAGSSAITAFEVFSYFPKQYEALKYILAIETTVNVIASVAYSKLITLIDKPNYGNITTFRYLDWFATTPLLLISFTLYLQYLKNTKNKDADKDADNNQANKSIVSFDYGKIGIIVLLNFVMLIFGFLGESNKLNHTIACLIGFIPFIIMFYLIWIWYGDYIKNKAIFGIFIIVWSLYGIVYFLPNNSKNISYNILDVIAKVGFGLLIWAEVVRLRFNNKIPNKDDFININ